MQRPNDAREDDTRLEFPRPSHALPEGLVLMKTDLAEFFRIVAMVGRDEALLLLVIRALRIRDGRDVSVTDLAWVLRTRNRAVLGWLDRLSDARVVVYTVTALPRTRRTGDRVQVEITRSSAAAPYAVMADLPTHWFVHVLPLMGRTTFAVYLYALSRESHDGVLLVADLVAAVGLRSPLHAHLHLRRLRRNGLLLRDANGNDILADPPPPTRAQRIRLRFLALPFLRRSTAHIAMLGVVLLVLGLALFLVLH